MHVKCICKINNPWAGKEKTHVWLDDESCSLCKEAWTLGMSLHLTGLWELISQTGQYYLGGETESLADNHLPDWYIINIQEESLYSFHTILSVLCTEGLSKSAVNVILLETITSYWFPPTKGRLIIPLPIPLLKLLTNVNSAALIQLYHCRTHDMSCCKKDTAFKDFTDLKCFTSSYYYSNSRVSWIPADTLTLSYPTGLEI